jgi:hypothetical protein
MSKICRDGIFSETKTLRECSTTSPRAWFHYLPLFAANQSLIRRYLPLISNSSAAICHYPAIHLPLFAANDN